MRVNILQISYFTLDRIHSFMVFFIDVYARIIGGVDDEKNIHFLFGSSTADHSPSQGRSVNGKSQLKRV